MKNIVNIINFIRACEPRPGRNIDLIRPVREQIRLMKKLNLKGTFLLQYDALCDKEIVDLLTDIPQDWELGLWLEIVQPQVEEIGLKWRGRYPWDWHNDVGFLMGYKPSDRKKLIDVHIKKFEEVFGFSPKSVGSWHIDAFSMEYLSEQYDIDACCICRDQVGTDGYTLQGGYYNQAYYPSKRNMFSPAQTRNNQIDMPVFRMLGSCPAFAYDFQVVDYDGVHGTIPTLESVQLAQNVEWGDFLLDEIFGGNGISFQYTQIGQENSFGWDKMKGGIEFQFEKAAKMKALGKIELLTLGETGRWFKNTYKATPIASYVADKQWKSNEVRSYWFNSKYYRVNFFIERGILRLRDMYVFNENYAEKYLDKECSDAFCEYRNLPIFDGVLYSPVNKSAKAGCYFLNGENRIVWDKVVYEEQKDFATISLKSLYGSLQIVLSESKINIITDIKDLRIVSVYDKVNVYGKGEEKDRRFGNHNGDATLTYIEKVKLEGNKIAFKFDDFDYSVVLNEGYVTEDFSFRPNNGKLTLSFLSEE